MFMPPGKSAETLSWFVGTKKKKGSANILVKLGNATVATKLNVKKN